MARATAYRLEIGVDPDCRHDKHCVGRNVADGAVVYIPFPRGLTRGILHVADNRNGPNGARPLEWESCGCGCVLRYVRVTPTPATTTTTKGA